MKKLMLFLAGKLPLITFAAAAGIIMRLLGVAYIAATGADYSFAQNPVYAPVFDVISSAGKDKSPGIAPDMQPEAGETDKTDKEKPSKKKNKNTGYISAKEQALLTGNSLKKVIAHRKKVSNGTYIYSDSFPDNVCSPVSWAVDYQVADPKYMDPAGTEYTYEDKGIFSLNGDYYTFQSVDDTYFDNALFIGDSQTDGLCKYGHISGHASFYGLEAITIYNIFNVTIPYRSPEEEYDTGLEELLKSHKYRKIYICVGINELGDPDTARYRSEYKKVLKAIRKYQKNAIIYIQSIIHLSADYSAHDPAFNNTNVVQRNQAISTLANGHDIFYLDPGPFLYDDKGDLNGEYTYDGIHLKAYYYPFWIDFLRNNACIRNKADR